MRFRRIPIWFLTGLAGGLLSISAQGALPGLINYQGKLTDPVGQPVSLVTEMTFTLYTEAVGGGELWSEAQTVTVTDGIFNLLLGAVEPLEPGCFPGEGEVYLGMAVGEDQEMSPRQRIVSTAYALRAETVTPGSIGAAEIAPGYGLVPMGTIVMWSGAAGAIPLGWTLCDGTQGTPDLRDRFIVGAGGNYAVGATGGAASVTLTVAQMPSHTHLQNAHNHTQNPHNHAQTPHFHDSTRWMNPDGNPYCTTYVGGSTRALDIPVTWADISSNTGRMATSYATAQNQASTAVNQATTAVNQNTGGGESHENRPPYYALCLIMKL